MLTTTSKTLLAKVQSGDTVGWEEFYHTYKELIVIVARQSAPGHCADEDIADLIQIVMLDLWKPGKFSFDPGKGIKFRTWFSSIVRNKLIDLSRKKRKHEQNHSSLEADGDFQLEIPVDAFEKVWYREWQRHLLHNALIQLQSEVSASTYQAFDLNKRQEMSPNEVAIILGITADKVHLSSCRCLKRLRVILEKLEEPVKETRPSPE